MKNRSQLYVMIIPAIMLTFIFAYIPMAGLIIAFRKYDIVSGLFGTGWDGFKYFDLFFRDPYFFRIIRNTLVINLYMMIFAFPAPIIFALLMNEIKANRIKKVFQSFSYIPHFVATVVVVGLMMEMLSSGGMVNQVISSLGLKKQLFFSEAGWFRFLYVSSSTWEGTGWRAIIYMAALTGINTELYENAAIEGANRFQKIKYVTIPGILPTIIILFILSMGTMMNVGFEKVFLMYNPGTYETADVISTYVYRRGILGMDYSYATAVGLFNSIINFLFLIGANYMARKGETSLW